MVHEDSSAVAVYTREEIDALLLNKWEGMKRALSSRDVEGAVSPFSSQSQENYRQQFTALEPLLGEIARELNSAQVNLVSLSGNRAEYEILVIREGTPLSFHLQFIRDRDGLWKIWKF